ncbi:mitochondrial import receptor subunit tom-70 [Botrytis cinerea]
MPPGKPMPNFAASTPQSSVWDRITTWASENKAVVYTIAGVAVVVSGAGVAYYLLDSKDSTSTQSVPKKSKEKRRRKKEEKKEADLEKGTTPPDSKPRTQAETVDELPEVDENTVGSLSDQQRKDYAAKLKAAAILCKPDPIFYSNRAACYNALGEFEKVIEDTTAAINLDSGYVKALNRRANAYEHTEKFSEALLDFTASCIIDGFRNEQSAQSVERLLKKVAESKAKVILEAKDKKLPSPTFVTNYLQSFRSKPAPAGLEDSAELSEETGKGQLQLGLRAMAKKTNEGYEDASAAFEKALDLGDLGEHEAFAYNMRGTFRYLRGVQIDALSDLSKSIELSPDYTQSYIKRASMHLELGDKDAAAADFDKAMEQHDDDPDIYYHRAQLNFILGELSQAAKDYQKSIDLDRDFIFSHIQLGVTQYKMGSTASSMGTFRRTIKAFEDVPDAYNYYGELLLDQQKYDEAISQFEKAVELEKQTKPLGMSVLPLINKALALFQWKQDFSEAEKLCEKALIIDPECDIAVATMAQLLLQTRQAELSRTEGEIVNALSYAEATRTQLEVQEKYPELASRLAGMSGLGGAGMR